MLKLKQLKLYNWCNLKGNKVIDFTDGYNVINGRNGKGKTSIVTAISILLLNDYEGSFETYINDTSTEAAISLSFEINGDDYFSSLELKKAKSTGSIRKLTKNGIEIATGEDCEKELNKLLPKFLTKFSLFYKQGDENKITECGDSDRRNLLTQLVSIDYTEKIKTRIVPDVDALKKQIEDMEKEVYALDNKTYTRGEEKLVAEKHPQGEIDALKAKVELWKENDQKIQKKKELEESVSKAEIEYSETQKKYDSATLNAEKDKKLEDLQKAADAQLAAIAAEKTKAKEDSKVRMQTLLDNSEKQKKELEAIVIKPLTEFDYSKITNVNSDLASLKTRHKIALDNCKSLEKGICPVCGSNCEHKLQDFQKEASDLTNWIAEAEAKAKEFAEEQKAYEDAKKANEDAVNRKVKLEAEQSTLDVKIQNEKDSVLNLLKTLKDKEKTIADNLEKDKASAIALTESQLATSKELIEQKKKYLDDLKKNLDDIKIVEVEDCRDELQKLESENAEIDKDIAYNEAIRKQNEDIEKQEADDKVKLEELTKTLIDLKKSLADHEMAVEIMSKTYPTWKLERELKGIENSTNIFIEEIYKPLYVEFTANKNSLKMMFGNGDRKLPIKRLSGAEKQITNLAVENVFNQQQGLSCLILDESDSAMDAENKLAFFSVLISLNEFYDQILVITHSKEIKDKLHGQGANIIML